MTSPRHMLAVLSGLSAVLACIASGCAARAAQPRSHADRLAPAAAGAPSEGVPVAMVGGETIAWSELHAGMVELSGVEALEEAALGTALRQADGRRAITIGEEQVQNEASLLLDTLARTAGVSANEAHRLLADLRSRRGLGPSRYRALLERNAMLRALVRADANEREGIEPCENDLRAAYDIKHGPRLRARIILLADAVQAERAHERLRTEPFDRVAADMSLDPSASRGGAITPVSLADAGQPAALRRVLSTLAPGAVSEPVSVDWGTGDRLRTGLAIIKHEGPEPADAAPAFEHVRDDLATEVRSVRERAAMERLGRTLMQRAGVRVLDPALGALWDTAQSPKYP